MILNGLSMMSQPLYMFPKFFELIACEHLIGAGVKAEYLNDDKLGRVLDKLFIKGLDTVFLAVSLNTVEIYQISLLSSHLDSTSFHVDGEYEYSLPEVIFKNQKESGSLEKENEEKKSHQAINLTYGYSRDHRPDLKQFITQLICSGDGDIPIYIKAVSGNEVDSKKFGEIAVEYQKRIQVNSLIVADSALYTESNIKLMSSLKWLTRVPLTIKLAKSLVMSLAESELAQREIRAALKSLNYTVKNQLGKAINNPTMRWIFQCFQSVHLVTFQQKTDFYNLTSEMKYILLFLPEACRNYYRYISENSNSSSFKICQ
jgi:transposase